MSSPTDLKDFLKTRRSRLTPEDIGLPADGGLRRVAGLRREEVAMAAAISLGYYTRMEQGRVSAVSADILDALAGVLRLDEEETRHLHRIAGATPRSGHRQLTDRDQKQTVRPALRHMLDSLMGQPALVMGRAMTVLAWNRAAAALLGDFGNRAPADRNIAKMTFLDHRSRGLHADWREYARENAGYLRLEAGRYPGDPLLTSVIGELSVKSPEFRTMWADHRVRDKTSGTKNFHHPIVGDLRLSYETLRVADNPRQALVVYSAEPGSTSADALRLLLDWTSDSPHNTVSS
ncbi:helix-turn-helix transcriptional regulator [Streptomyces sp. NBC_01604]|uniref:helix-turn-helix transcriptional regulator n=1 Tax=Streptomyces sp. NBC_01604 TaxID=2975894 RepID=UPI00386E8D77